MKKKKIFKVKAFILVLFVLAVFSAVTFAKTPTNACSSNRKVATDPHPYDGVLHGTTV